MTAMPVEAGAGLRTSWGGWLVTRLMLAALLWPLFFLATNPLRLAFVADTFVPFAMGNLLLSALCSLVAVAWIDRIRFSVLDLAMLGALVLTALVTDWQAASTRNLFVDILKPLAFTLTVVAIREFVEVDALLGDGARKLRAVASALGWATVATVVASHLISAFVVPLYPAYASVDSLLPLAWLASAGMGWATLGYLVVLVASGKRGVYLAALVVAWASRRLWLRRPQALTLLAIAAVATIGLSVVEPEWVAGNVLKIQDPAGDVALQASGYRLAEIDGALATMSHPIDWLAGKGFGFSFEAPGFVGAEGEDEAHRNLHFTPLSILVYYGLAFAVPFYWLLVTCTVRSVRMIRGGSAPAVVGAFFIGHLAFSFTEFSVFVYATFAVSCGLVLAMSREHDHGRRKAPSQQE
jgi:hypothetical protein